MSDSTRSSDVISPGVDPLHDVLALWGIAGTAYGGLPAALRKSMSIGGDMCSTTTLVWEHGDVDEAVGRKLELIRRTLGGMLAHDLLRCYSTVATEVETSWTLFGDSAEEMAKGLRDVGSEVGIAFEGAVAEPT